MYPVGNVLDNHDMLVSDRFTQIHDKTYRAGEGFEIIRDVVCSFGDLKLRFHHRRFNRKNSRQVIRQQTP